MPDVASAPRIRFDRLLDEDDRRSALHDATFWSLRGDPPRELPAVWLYDERGSRLFDEITRLPEYYLTRAEREILGGRAEEIAASGVRTLVELGSGTSEKTRLLLDALEAAGTLESFVPLDVSEEVLRASAEAIAARYRGVGVHALVADFERHLDAVPDAPGRLVAFLGSTIGNLGPARRARLLQAIAAVLAPGDRLLLGVDLVKDPARLEAAYNDSRGVTETFVRNGLEAVNRELDADFDQRRLEFVARWDAEQEWMDIGFQALRSQVVSIRGLEIEFALRPGEALRLEISAKFRRERIEAELASAGLSLDEWWTDRRGDFALLLASGNRRGG